MNTHNYSTASLKTMRAKIEAELQARNCEPSHTVLHMAGSGDTCTITKEMLTDTGYQAYVITCMKAALDDSNLNFAINSKQIPSSDYQQLLVDEGLIEQPDSYTPEDNQQQAIP